MKNNYQIKVVKDGVEQVFNQEIIGDIDELHIVSTQVLRKETEERIAQIHKENSFKEKYFPAVVFFGSLFVMGLIVLNNWGWI